MALVMGLHYRLHCTAGTVSNIRVDFESVDFRRLHMGLLTAGVPEDEES
jgi:hypothetical protein